MPPPGYFKRLNALCKRRGILLIADEVMVGAGRLGPFFASPLVDCDADIIVIGKGLSGGYLPLSAVLIKEELATMMAGGSGGFLHSQTFQGIPTLMAAGLAAVQYWQKNQLDKNVEKLGPKLIELLRSEILPLSSVGDVRSFGFLAGIEFVADQESKKPFDRSKKWLEGFILHAFEQGLVLWPSQGHVDGVNGDIITLAPALNATEAHLEECVGLLKRSIETYR